MAIGSAQWIAVCSSEIESVIGYFIRGRDEGLRSTRTGREIDKVRPWVMRLAGRRLIIDVVAGAAVVTGGSDSWSSAFW